MSSLPRKPRLWTEAQVQFVLDEVASGKPHKEIAAAFNEKYAGVSTIKTDHIKYIKAQYRDRLNDTPPRAAGMTLAQPGSISGDGGALGTRSANNISQTPAKSRNKLSFSAYESLEDEDDIAGPATRSRAQGRTRKDRRATMSEYPNITPRAHSAESSDSEPTVDVDPNPTVDDLDLAWQSGTHDDCPINGQHQHTADGVKFLSPAAVEDMRQKTRVFTPSVSEAVARDLKKEMDQVTRKTPEAIQHRRDVLSRDEASSSFFDPPTMTEKHCSGGGEASRTHEQRGNDIGTADGASRPSPHIDVCQAYVPDHDHDFPEMEDLWNDGPHDGCDVQAEHRHEADGGVCFRSVDAVMDMVASTNGSSVSLSELADMMERS